MKRKRDTNKEFVEAVHHMFDCAMNLSTIRMIVYIGLFAITDGLILIVWSIVYSIKRIINARKEIKEINKELMEKYGMTKKEIKEHVKRALKEGGDC